MEAPALDLSGIAAALTALTTACGVPVDVARRVGDGYAYVDFLVRDRIDVFRYGGSRHLLELNHRVLCGVDPERRLQFAAHIAETERRFYDEAHGVAEFFDWSERHRDRAAETLAAGAFVRVVSGPQLFIEGNRRTASLLASYCLARRARPPLVVTPDGFADYATLADTCAAVRRGGAGGAFGLALAGWRIRRFIERSGRPEFLLDASRLAPIAGVR